jgi:hypothetical protein
MHDHKRRTARLASILAATTVSLGAIVAMPVGAGGATIGATHATRTVSLNETGRLHLVSKHGFTLNELGTASGTLAGSISVRLTIASTSRVSAEVSISPQGGSISGSGTAAYHKGETSASFSGALSINHRSGRYADAEGSGLKFSGTIARSDDAVTVHVSGRLSQ